MECREVDSNFVSKTKGYFGEIFLGGMMGIFVTVIMSLVIDEEDYVEPVDRPFTCSQAGFLSWTSGVILYSAGLSLVFLSRAYHVTWELAYRRR